MENVIKFLTENGFTLREDLDGQVLSNGKCLIQIVPPSDKTVKGYYAVTIVSPQHGTIYSDDLNLYWLVGLLTWYNLIDRNYKGGPDD